MRTDAAGHNSPSSTAHNQKAGFSKVAQLTMRPARSEDVADIATMFSSKWRRPEFWERQILQYLSGRHSPERALETRMAFVALRCDRIVGLAAGHLTRRFGCQGELQWIRVAQGEDSALYKQLFAIIANWFAHEKANRICVNVYNKNQETRRLYSAFGARPLGQHWMTWNDFFLETSAGR